MAFAAGVSAQSLGNINSSKKQTSSNKKPMPSSSSSNKQTTQSSRSQRSVVVRYNTPVGVKFGDDLLWGVGAVNQLKVVADFVKDNDNIDYVYVIGFSNWSGGGSSDFKQKLSEQRAELTKKKLVSLGIDENLIYTDAKVGICDVDGVVVIALDRSSKDDQFWDDITNAIYQIDWR